MTILRKVFPLLPAGGGGGGGGGAVGLAVQHHVVLDDFSNQRLANNGSDLYFNVYNGAVNDAGPNQVVTSVGGGVFKVTMPQGDVYYVDADCPQYTSSPSHWLQGHIESGVWNSLINRMSFLMRPSVSFSGAAGSGGDNFNFGTYIKPLSNTSPGAEGSDPQNGHHYYHSSRHSGYANRWQLFQFDNCPQHERGDAGSVDYNPITEYFHQMTRFYIQDWGFWPDNAMVMDLGPVHLYHRANEPDDEIRSVSIVYTGERYEVTWAGRKNVSRTYEIRYRTDGTSLSSAGFATGTDGGTTTNPGSDYTGCHWQSPLMGESTQGIFVGIRVQSAAQFREIYLPYQVSPTNMGLVET